MVAPFAVAQVWVAPAEIEVTPAPAGMTSTGTLLETVSLLPNLPGPFKPQHRTPPLTIAHA